MKYRFPLFLSCILILMTGCDELMVKDISRVTISDPIPIDDAVVRGAVRLSWDPVEYAEYYHLMLVSPSFSEAQHIWADTLLAGNSFTPEELVSGRYQWYLQACNSEYKTVPRIFSFRVQTAEDIGGQMPVVLSPAEEAELSGKTVSFSWEPLPGAETYRLLIVSPTFESVQEVIKDTVFSTSLYRISLPDGNYQWRLQALNAEFESLTRTASFRVRTTADLGSKKVMVLAPTDGLELQNPDVLFSWESLAGAENYRVMVVSPRFDQPQQWLEDTMTEETTLRLNLADGDYQWRIQASNTASASEAVTQSFRIQTAAYLGSKKVAVLAPTDGLELQNPDVLFSWEPLAGAENYRIMVVSPGFDQPQQWFENTVTGETAVRLNLPDGDYQWRIQASNTTSTSETVTQSFRVRTAVDIGSKKVAVLAPINGLELRNPDVLFSWEPLAGAENYRVMVVSPGFDQPQQWFENTVTGETAMRLNLPDGEYQWRIQASNTAYTTQAVTHSFYVRTAPDISQKMITIVSPASGATLTRNEVVFSWEPLKDADSYRIRIVSPSFNPIQMLVEDATLTETLFRTTLPDGEYQWSIQGLNPASHTSAQVCSFRVQAGTDLTHKRIDILAPSPDAEVASGQMTFAWEALSGAENYRLTIVSPSFEQAQTLIEDVTQTQTNFRVNLNEGSYQWRIQALNEGSRTTPQIYKLRVFESGDIRSKSVNVLSPQAGAVLPAGEAVFFWEALSGAETYHLTIVSPTFGNIQRLVADTDLSGTSFRVDLAPGTYQWRIYARRGDAQSLVRTYDLTVSP